MQHEEVWPFRNYVYLEKEMWILLHSVVEMYNVESGNITFALISQSITIQVCCYSVAHPERLENYASDPVLLAV